MPHVHPIPERRARELSRLGLAAYDFLGDLDTINRRAPLGPYLRGAGRRLMARARATLGAELTAPQSPAGGPVMPGDLFVAVLDVLCICHACAKAAHHDAILDVMGKSYPRPSGRR